MHFEASYFGKRFQNIVYDISMTKEVIVFLTWFCCCWKIQQDFIPWGDGNRCL